MKKIIIPFEPGYYFDAYEKIAKSGFEIIKIKTIRTPKDKIGMQSLAIEAEVKGEKWVF